MRKSQYRAPDPAPTTLPAEHFDELTQLCAEPGVMGYIHILLDYPTALDAPRLGTALRRLIDAEPVLGCRFDDSGRKPVWRRRDDLDAIAACALKRSTDIAADTTAWLGERFDARSSANIGCTVLRPADGTGDRILLRFSHVAGDGASVLSAIAGLAEIYNRLAAEPDYAPAANTAGRDSFCWLKGFSRRDRLTLFRHELANFRRAFKPHRGLTLGDASRFLDDLAGVVPAYRVLRLDAGRVAAIDRYARAARAGFNDVLLAAYARAFDAFCPSPADRDLVIGLPVDLRRYAPLQRRPAFMNLTGGAMARLAPIDGEPFERTLTRVQQEMQRHRKRFVGTEIQLLQLLLARISFARKRRFMQRYLARNVSKPLAPVLTNLGRVAASRFACDGTAPSGIAMLTYPAPLPVFAVSAIRMDDRLALGMSFDRRCGTRPVEAFLRRLDRELPGYAETGAGLLEGR